MVVPIQDSQAGASQTRMSIPATSPSGQPSAWLCPAIASSSCRLPNTSRGWWVRAPTCAPAGNTQLRPFASQVKRQGLARLLAFQLCHTTAGPVSPSASIPGCSWALGWENIGCSLLIPCQLPENWNRGAPTHLLPVVGAPCRVGFRSSIPISSVAALDAMELHPTLARTAQGGRESNVLGWGQ